MELVGSPETPHLVDLERLPVVELPVSCLAAADSPRRSGESPEHVRRLAESETQLPPILVHRSTMRVVDGMHRLRAAQLHGQETIKVRYVDGDEASAFVLGVRANIAHGLPLRLADRKAAAARIMELYPHWSDRMIGQATGLAAKTVAASRRRLSGEKQQLDVRVGRDGRARPVDGAARRAVAARLISDNPTASLREIARRAGLSPETVRGLRAHMDPALAHAQQLDSGSAVGRVSPSRSPQQRSGTGSSDDGVSALRALRADPAFRSNELGRCLLRMLSSYLMLQESRGQFLDNVPAHCLGRVAEAARACALGWQDFAQFVEEAGESSSPSMITRVTG